MIKAGNVGYLVTNKKLDKFMSKINELKTINIPIGLKHMEHWKAGYIACINDVFESLLGVDINTYNK